MNNDYIKHIGNRIFERRERLGIKQAEVAKKLDITPQAVSKWERGENAPDLSLMVPLSNILNISTDWLLGVKLLDAVKNNFLFKSLSDNDTNLFLSYFDKKLFKKNEYLYQEKKQMETALYILETGKVKLSKDNQELDILSSGNFFSDYSFIDLKDCSTSALAVEDSLIYFIMHSKYKEFINDYPKIGITLLEKSLIIASSRLRKLE